MLGYDPFVVHDLSCLKFANSPAAPEGGDSPAPQKKQAKVKQQTRDSTAFPLTQSTQKSKAEDSAISATQREKKGNAVTTATPARRAKTFVVHDS